MIDRNDLYAEVQSILSMLDADALPECWNRLAAALAGAEDEMLQETPYDLAASLIALDRPEPFPDYLIGFLTDLYETAIAEGSADAMNDLGALYYGGDRGFAQSFEKAIRYYKMAAAAGSRQAQENLGYCYYYGRDGRPDYEKAFHCFALGAFDGHLVSLYKIGDMYLNGLYVERNEREAFSIFLHCVQTMTPEAEGRVAGPVYLRLGRMLLEGLGTQIDPKGALICYQKAEGYLYDMVSGGDVMYRKSLQAAVAGQAKSRAVLEAAFPGPVWAFD